MKQRENILKRLQIKVDEYQQKHTVLAFIFGVQKKYNEDQAGYAGALITYYAFLSIFPLIAVLTSILQLKLFDSFSIKAKVYDSINQHFPVIGSQLQNNIHGFSKEGLILIVSILVTLYGATGVGNAIQNSMNNFWKVPKSKRDSGVKQSLRSLALIIFSGVGIIIETSLSGFIGGFGSSEFHRVVLIIVSLLSNFVILLLVFKLGLSKKVSIKKFVVGTGLAAIGLEIIQTFGVFIVTHEIKKLDLLYGSFAIVLGLMFWLYLQVRIIIYAAEIDCVRNFSLWPIGFFK